MANKSMTGTIVEGAITLYNVVELTRYLTDHKHHYEPMCVIAARGCKKVIKGTGVQKVLNKGYRKVKHALT